MAIKRVLLFGGSFDPVHTGHVELLKEVQIKLQFDRVIVLPALNSPFKQGRAGTAPLERIEMLKLALAGLDFCEVSDMEFTMPSPSYTVNTLERITSEHADWRLHWLCGWDVVEELDKWYRAQDVMRLAAFVVMKRPGNQPPPANLPAEIIEVETKLYDISSTAIRAALEAGRMPEQLPEAVQNYIRKKGLYGWQAGA